MTPHDYAVLWWMAACWVAVLTVAIVIAKNL